MPQRKDPKGRNLREGEYWVESRKKYRYRYRDSSGNYHDITSFRLTEKDPIPFGMTYQDCIPLRKLEEEIAEQVKNNIQSHGGKMSVLSLVKEYVAFRTNPKNPNKVKTTTAIGYQTRINFLTSDPMGQRKIADISRMEAQKWFINLQAKGHGYSSLNQLKGVLKPAFEYAISSNWISSNPFAFDMSVIHNDSTKRDAISAIDMRRFLDFVRTSNVYYKYFDIFYILFTTGIRCSELCGLTESDIDFDSMVIHIRRELMRHNVNGTMEYYIESPKTVNSNRDVPMIKGVDECFKHVINTRTIPQGGDPVVYDIENKISATKFLFFDKDGRLLSEQHVDNYFRHAVARFNSIYKQEIPNITPHICRHTFASMMASRGMSVKTLQTILGHARYETTMDIYTHLGIDVIKKETETVMSGGNKNLIFYSYQRKPQTVAPFDDEEEPNDD